MASTGNVSFGVLCAAHGSCFFGWAPEGQTNTISCQSGFLNVTSSGYGGNSSYTSCQNYAASTCTGVQTCVLTFDAASCGSEPSAAGSNAGFVNVTCADEVQPAVVRFADFTASIGVQTHLGANTEGNLYSNFQNVVANLKYLGVTHVRDAALPPNSPDALLVQAYDLMHQSGIQLLVGAGTGSPDLTALMASFDNMMTQYPSSLTAIEGPNEIDNFPFSYGGLNGQPAADQFQKDLYAAVHADPKLAGIPVVNYTTGAAYFLGTGATNQGNGAGVSDFANIHPYANNGFGGYQPGWYIPYTSLLEFGSMSVTPMIITEAGFNTATSANGVALDAQAILTVNTLFDATIDGIARTYFYELLDLYADATNADSSDHWGLFDGQNQPKPAATALHNLIEVLADPSANASSFTPIPITYSVASLPVRARTLLLQAEDGRNAIAMWDESHTLAGESQVDAPGAPVTISLDGVFGSVSLYDPIAGTTTPLTLAGKTAVVTLSASPLLILLKP